MRVGMKTNNTEQFAATLRSEATSYGVSLSANSIVALAKYYDLLQRWNARLHLVAPCTAQQFATRHVLESLVLLKHLPEDAKVVEVGAGAGLPMIPCLIVRTDLQAVLIEASKKKGVFLREALAHVGASSRGKVIDERFETTDAPDAGFITCRALERFDEMLPRLLQWAPNGSTLLLFGAKRLERRIENEGFKPSAELMPNSKARYLLVVKKAG